ncbi:MAG: BON domain-containing protein, partial [Gammaproteobacteria bacterium]
MSTHRVVVLRFLVLLCALHALAGCAPLTATGAAISGDRRTTGTVIDDEQIESKANKFFAADAELAQSCHINVTSYNQQVLLTGECPTEQLRAKAADYTGRVAKVRHIFNEIALDAP